MGDRTTVIVFVLKPHAKIVFAAMGYGGDTDEMSEQPRHYDPENVVKMEFYEVNYGGWDELREAAESGACFLGYSGSGGAYGAMMTIGLDGRCFQVSGEDEPLVGVSFSEDGSPYVASGVMEKLREWEAARREVERRFHLSPLEKLVEPERTP